jgi:Na+/proline symporter
MLYLLPKVAMQVLGVGIYFGFIATLYWRRLTDAGAVAIIVGLLFFLKALASSGAISIAHLFPWDPKAVARSPRVELLRTGSFLAVGVGLATDLRSAVDLCIVPDRIDSVAILLTVMVVFVSGTACCFIRMVTAVRFWS